MMENFVFEYLYFEIGGNLFGLWIRDGDVVLYVVLGLGRNCERIGVLFY